MSSLVPSPSAFLLRHADRAGVGFLWLSFGCGLSILAIFLWKVPDYVFLVPALFLTLPVLLTVHRHGLIGLATVLGAYVIASNVEEGIQLTELAYGLYYMSFLVYWYVSRPFLYREKLVWNRDDIGLLLLLFWIPLCFLLTPLFGGNIRMALSEAAAMAFIAFAFPVAEACTRYKHGARTIAAVLLWLGLFIAVRHILDFQSKIASAEYLWQIARGRVATNETFLLLGALLSLVLFAHLRKRRMAILLVGLVGIYLGVLVITQARAYWVDFVLGVSILFLLVRRPERVRLLALGLGGIAIAGGLLYLILGDIFLLMMVGLGERVISLGTATQDDISLINRFYEGKAAWMMILESPIIGNGMGVRYSHFDLIDKVTQVKGFVHNGFLGIWLRYGLIGLVLILFVWLRGAWLGIRSFRKQQARLELRLFGLFCAISLFSLLPSAAASGAFYLADSTLTFAILVGLSEGTYRRIRIESVVTRPRIESREL